MTSIVFLILLELNICYLIARPCLLYSILLLEFTNLAEREGFEPSVGSSPTTVFKTVRLNRSRTSPDSGFSAYAGCFITILQADEKQLIFSQIALFYAFTIIPLLPEKNKNASALERGVF